MQDQAAADNGAASESMAASSVGQEESEAHVQRGHVARQGGLIGQGLTQYRYMHQQTVPVHVSQPHVPQMYSGTFPYLHT